MRFTYKSHLKTSEDLETTYESTRKGFVAMAFEKNIRATPMVKSAKELKSIISNLKTPRELLDKKEIYPALLTASGLSEKAIGHLKNEDKVNAIEILIRNFLEPAGENFADEVVYRYLLTRGDSLGGTMRNVAGWLGEVKFIRALMATLELNKIEYYWQDSETCIWAKKKEEDTKNEIKTNGLFWNNGNDRTLILNSNIPIVKKNIDLILVNGNARNIPVKKIENKYFIALGELKGGIDPAGADEHWKTANSALGRIKTAFGGIDLNPKTFFIGAAVEKSMASEIFNQLENGHLDNACNLNGEEQLCSICNWLIEL